MSDSQIPTQLPAQIPPTDSYSPKKRTWLRLFLRYTFFLFCCWVVCTLLVTYLLTHRVFPAKPTADPTYAIVQKVRLKTTDGEEIGSWYQDGKSGTPVVICLHGYGGERSTEHYFKQFIVENGYALMTITLRSHGDSTGWVKDFGLSSRHDLIAAVDWLKLNQPNRQIVVFGRSYGAATALFAAGDLGHSVKGYSLESPFADIFVATRNRTKMLLPGVIEPLFYFGLWSSAHLMLSNVNEISPANAALKMPAGIPCQILAGEIDQHATLDEARTIQANLGERSQLIIFPDARHGTLHMSDIKKYQQTILGFIQSVTK